MNRLIALTIFLPLLAFAGIDDVVNTETWVLEVLKFFTTIKGLGTLAVVAGAVQLAMIAFQTPLANVAGKYRLVAVAGFSAIGLLLGAMATGQSLGAAVLSAPVLAALQVFANQIYKQFFEKVS